MTTQTNHTTSLERITKWEDMEGKTIRYVVESPAAERAGNIAAVLVFDDSSWATIRSSDDESEVSLYSASWNRANSITDIVTPNEMMNAGLVNGAQYKILVEQVEQRRRAELERQAQMLRNRLEAIGLSPSEVERNAAISDAADFIEHEAASLAETHAPKGDWTGEDEAKAEYDSMIAKATALRAIVPATKQPTEKAAA